MANSVLKEDDDKTLESEELVIVEDKSKLTAELDEDDDDKDERPNVEAAADAPDDERDGIRERRRLEKVERKDRRDKAITRDKTEMDFLRKRNDELERRIGAQEQRAHATDLNSYDAHINNARNEADMAERVIAKAVDAGNGADVAQAMRYRDQALAKVQQLGYAKQQAAQQAAAPANQGVDDRTMSLAREFMSENKWYDAQGRDEDSAIVLAIDQGLMRDGFNPQTHEYWDELRIRAARRLPERFDKATHKDDAPAREERAPRGGPAISSGREHTPSSTRKEVYISPDRKQALIDAGVWDDPTLRQRYVKRYQAYDAENRAKA